MKCTSCDKNLLDVDDIIYCDYCDSADTLLKRIKVNSMLGNYDKVVEDTDLLIRVKPEYSFICIYRGDFFNYINEFEKAIDNYTAAIGAGYVIPRLYAMRGDMYLKLKDKEKARCDYMTYLTLADVNDKLYKDIELTLRTISNEQKNFKNI